MDLLQLPRTVVRVQLRLLRLPLTAVEVLTQRDSPTASQSSDDGAREGLVEGVFGRAKQLVGVVMGNDTMVAEGRLQEAKAEQQRDAAAQEAIADQKRQRANKELAERQAEANAKRADTARETAERQRRLERERSERKEQVDEVTDLREGLVEQAGAAKKAVATKKQVKAAQTRTAKKAGADVREEAADQARARADALRRARTDS